MTQRILCLQVTMNCGGLWSQNRCPALHQENNGLNDSVTVSKNTYITCLNLHLNIRPTFILYLLFHYMPETSGQIHRKTGVVASRMTVVDMLLASIGHWNRQQQQVWPVAAAAWLPQSPMGLHVLGFPSLPWAEGQAGSRQLPGGEGGGVSWPGERTSGPILTNEGIFERSRLNHYEYGC